MRPRGRPTPALVFGGGITALGVLRALGRAGIPSYLVGPGRDVAAASRYARRGLAASLAETGDPQALASFLEDLPLDTAVLVACSDLWSTAVAALPEAIATRFPASIPPPATLALFVDKWRFAETLEATAVPHPRTTLLEREEDLGLVGGVDLAGFFLKPRNSQLFADRYKVKAFRLSDRAEAAARLADVTGAGLEAVLQEYVPGPPTAHHFIDGFIDRTGRVCALFARRRLRMFPPDFGNSTIMVSEPVGDVAQAAADLERLLTSVRYRGIFSAEFKHDERDGLFKILEVNTRPWWYIEFAALCGVDVASLAYRDALGVDVEPVPGYRVGYRYAFLSEDIRAFWHLRRRGELSLGPWLTSLKGAERAIMRWDDPLPSLARTAQLARKALRRRPGR